MKIILIILGVCAAIGGVSQVTADTSTTSDHYQWHQMAPAGRGSSPEHWSPGKWPMGIAPTIAFDETLWMVWQKWAWSSSDGLNWTGYAKKDWGERISITYFFFDQKLWAAGGMMYNQPQTGFRNDIWNSADGKNWSQVSAGADWQPRRSPRIIIFKNRVWLFGGAIESGPDKGPRHFLNDIWSSEDGIKWSQVTGAKRWGPRDPAHILAFKDHLWLIGSERNTEIWRSDDGISWVQVASQTPWKGRYAYGTAVFDEKIWVYGGQESMGNTSALNDVWYTADGIQWLQQSQHAPWSPRIPWSSTVFKNRLWIFGGKPGRDQGNAEDIWALTKE